MTEKDWMSVRPLFFLNQLASLGFRCRSGQGRVNWSSLYRDCFQWFVHNDYLRPTSTGKQCWLPRRRCLCLNLLATYLQSALVPRHCQAVGLVASCRIRQLLGLFDLSHRAFFHLTNWLCSYAVSLSWVCCSQTSWNSSQIGTDSSLACSLRGTGWLLHWARSVLLYRLMALFVGIMSSPFLLKLLLLSMKWSWMRPLFES